VPQRPNVLFIMTDHTNAEATAPSSQCLTPNLDKLAAEGVRFGRCYTTNAICSPARASLMTATYPSTHGVWDCTHTQATGWINLRGDLAHWAQRLSQAGYSCGYFGKWHAEPTVKLEDFGWGQYDIHCGKARLERIPGSEITVPKEGYRDYVLSAAGRDDGQAVRHPAFEAAIAFIRRQRSRGKPFCCCVSACEPHDPYVPPKRFLDMYDVDAIRVSPTLRDDLAGKPEVLKRMRGVWAELTEQDWRKISASYWAVITFLDAETGRILEALREGGLYDKTVIVFTSDHGDMLGGHGLATKGVGTAYEEVYNIPLIMRVPGLSPAGQIDDAVMSLVDIAPTLVDLCGAEPMPTAQGRSLRPLLEGSAEKNDWQDAYAEFFGQRFVYTQRIVWHGNWKYVFSPGGMDELYDLAADPHEMRNLAGEPARREMLVDMCKRMWLKMREIGDESLFKAQYATLRTAPVGPRSIDED
jgi:arylsulfatase A-like enzyme